MQLAFLIETQRPHFPGWFTAHMSSLVPSAAVSNQQMILFNVLSKKIATESKNSHRKCEQVSVSCNLCYSPNWSLGNIKDTGVILSPLAFCEGNFLTSWMMNVRLLALIQVLFQVLALVQVLFQILVGGLVKFSAPKADQCSWYWSRPTAEKRFINLWKWKGSKLSTWQFWTEIDWV